jgi:hypothetical protein
MINSDTASLKSATALKASELERELAEAGGSALHTIELLVLLEQRMKDAGLLGKEVPVEAQPEQPDATPGICQTLREHQNQHRRAHNILADILGRAVF